MSIALGPALLAAMLIAKPNSAPKAESELRDFSDAVASVAERAVPSVVNISTTQLVQGHGVEIPSDLPPLFRRFFEEGLHWL